MLEGVGHGVEGVEGLVDSVGAGYPQRRHADGSVEDVEDGGEEPRRRRQRTRSC